jgi:hypothetical protein
MFNSLGHLSQETRSFRQWPLLEGIGGPKEKAISMASKPWPH